MTHPTISIIIPVYKVEKYLNRCLDSILNQSFTDWECLLIDDGSPDNSGKICDEYAAKDDRFRVFHKENGGVSRARNLGLDNALGEWITFVDSDDFLAETYFENLMKPIIENRSVSFVHGCGTYYENGKPRDIIEQFPDELSSDPVHLFNLFKGYVCGKLFKREIIENSALGQKIRFNPRIRYSEDMVFTLEYVLGVETYAFSSEVGYYYNRDNGGSATHSIKMTYEESLYAFNLKYDYEMSYIQMKKIREEDICNRVILLAKSLFSILVLLNKMPLSRAEKISKIKQEIGIGKLHVLRYLKLPIIASIDRHLFVNGRLIAGLYLLNVASIESAIYNKIYSMLFNKMS